MTPYISFVVASRNDNYGGNQVRRMQIFINALLSSWKKHDLDAELLIVEWNPPLDRPRLKDVLEWPKDLKLGCVRMIDVPSEFHYRFPNSEKMPIFEHIAKNVGVRRARGKYVLVTDPDVLYSDELIGFLSSKSLSPDAFYRVDRYDTDPDVPVNGNLKDQLAFCVNHVRRVDLLGATIMLRRPPVGWGRVDFAMERFLLTFNRAARRIGDSLRIEDRLYTNASGSFTLMLSDRWAELRGYPELATQGHIDAYIIVMATSAGLRQIILPRSMRIYHMEHQRAIDWINVDKTTRPLTSFEQWERDSKEMLRDMKPKIINDESWGLANQVLSEYVIR
jgi:hypothetical protein